MILRSGGAPGPRFDQQRVLEGLRGVRIVSDEVDGELLIEAREALEEYAWLHGRSARLSLEMLARHVRRPAGRPLRVLELGGAPYFFSALMLEHFDAELTAVSVEAGAWPGEPARRPRGTVRITLEGERSADIDVRVFNIEKDAFPLPDDYFDVVLCMEVLEHLGYSPSHMLAESHRALVPDGLMLITVPNFINIKRTVNMLLNRPTEFPYSGYGIYGRHQREYAPLEVSRLLEANHYHVAELATANVWPTFRDSMGKGIGNAALNGLSRLPLPWMAHKREYILCAGRPYGEAVVAYPEWLYEHRHMYPEPPNGIPALRE
jgi:SAM-dependent methyltransferase